jgi:NAD-dependent deacetylase
MDDRELRIAADILRDSERIVVFTGAGISAESGIPTFRDDGGFWSEFPPEQFATMNGLLSVARSEPRRLATFVYSLIEPIARAEPNAGHRAIADLERHRSVEVITQNIDGLHQRAGSTTVREVHGSLFEIVTAKGGFVRLLSRDDIAKMAAALARGIERGIGLVRFLLTVRLLFGVGLRGTHRPTLVLFGEGMREPDWSASLAAAESCDCMIVVGTSGLVLPAAMIPVAARDSGARIIGIGPEVDEGHVQLRSRAGAVLPALVSAAFPDEPSA